MIEFVLSNLVFFWMVDNATSTVAGYSLPLSRDTLLKSNEPFYLIGDVVQYYINAPSVAIEEGKRKQKEARLKFLLSAVVNHKEHLRGGYLNALHEEFGIKVRS